jgi:hypothetical protein
MAEPRGVVEANLRLLEQGLALVERLPPAVYSGADGEAKPVGPHFRHVLEHYSCFLAGFATRRIDYDGRARERAIETEPAAARERIRELLGGLTLVGPQDYAAPTEVRLECGEGVESDQWSRSTVHRELQFLLSHTVHHYALIGLLLARRGIETGEDFGVAPSTLKHWQDQASCAPRPG